MVFVHSEPPGGNAGNLYSVCQRPLQAKSLSAEKVKQLINSHCKQMKKQRPNPERFAPQIYKRNRAIYTK